MAIRRVQAAGQQEVQSYIRDGDVPIELRDPITLEPLRGPVQVGQTRQAISLRSLQQCVPDSSLLVRKDPQTNGLFTWRKVKHRRDLAQRLDAIRYGAELHYRRSGNLPCAYAMRWLRRYCAALEKRCLGQITPRQLEETRLILTGLNLRPAHVNSVIEMVRRGIIADLSSLRSLGIEIREDNGSLRVTRSAQPSSEGSDRATSMGFCLAVLAATFAGDVAGLLIADTSASLSGRCLVAGTVVSVLAGLLFMARQDTGAEEARYPTAINLSQLMFEETRCALFWFMGIEEMRNNETVREQTIRDLLQKLSASEQVCKRVRNPQQRDHLRNVIAKCRSDIDSAIARTRSFTVEHVDVDPPRIAYPLLQPIMARFLRKHSQHSQRIVETADVVEKFTALVRQLARRG